MTQLRLIPKPEGFELRDKRSSKHSSAAEWTPQDALYDASQGMNADVTDVVVVLWRGKDGELNYRKSGLHDTAIALCAKFINARA